jgi:hypothetical protein
VSYYLTQKNICIVFSKVYLVQLNLTSWNSIKPIILSDLRKKPSVGIVIKTFQKTVHTSHKIVKNFKSILKISENLYT